MRNPLAGLAARSTPGAGSTAAADRRLLRGTRLRLAAWSGAVTLAVLVALGAAVYVAVMGSLDATSTGQLQDRAHTVRTFLQRTAALGGPLNDRTPVGFAFGGRSSSTFAMIVGPDDNVFGPETGQPAGLPNGASIAVARQGTEDIRDADLAGTPVRILSEPVDVAGGRLVVQIVQDRTAEQRTLNTLLDVLLVGGAAVVLLAVGAGAVYSGRALVPISRSLRRQREFAADASHEIRTPLAVIRGSVEDLRRHPGEPAPAVGTALDDIEAEVAHLTELVDDLLLLARTDSGAVSLEQVPVDLSEVAVDALSSLGQLAASRDVRVVLDPSPAPALGDPARLRQLVTILVDNAVRHSPAGGTVMVRVRLQGAEATLDVEDEGAGVRPQDMPHVFDRFWRAQDAPHGGTGLGLSIAAWIVEQHGGTISVGNRAEGGARFRATLRRAPDAARSHA